MANKSMLTSQGIILNSDTQAKKPNENKSLFDDSIISNSITNNDDDEVW